MALIPDNDIHAQQIEAGTTGRKKGHKFESILTESINSINLEWFNSLVIPNISEHIHKGNPAVYLLKFIMPFYGFEKIDEIKAWWVGALATSGKGDVLLDEYGNPIAKCKSDVVIRLSTSKKIRTVGVSVKTCSKATPTNDQLYFTTAQAFCKLLRDNSIPVSANAELAMKMFCGDAGVRPVDVMNNQQLSNRFSDPERWFWEELPQEGKTELEYILSYYQKQITLILLQKAYKNDPYAPDFLLHQRVYYTDFNECPLALFSIEQLVNYSCKVCGYTVNNYQVRKGRYKGDPNTHQAPRFGYVQFQRGGQKQHPTQLQFNLQAGYFNKLAK